MRFARIARGSATGLAALALVATLGLSGCGGDKSTTATPNGNPAVSAPADNGCPAEATRKLAKTRAAANAALAFGAFHRYLYKPYKAGTFQKGADGRKRALVKGGVAAVFIADQLRRFKNNVLADPALCGAIKGTLDTLIDKMSGLKGKLAAAVITGADVSSELDQDEGLFQQFAGQSGIQEDAAASVPGAD